MEEFPVEIRRFITQKERTSLRNMNRRYDRGDLFDEVLIGLELLPTGDHALEASLKHLRELFYQTAKRDKFVVYEFFERYLLQVEDIDVAAESLTTLSYRNDKELDESIDARWRAEKASEGRETIRRRYIAKEIAFILAGRFAEQSLMPDFTDANIRMRVPDMIRVHKQRLEEVRQDVSDRALLARDRFHATVLDLTKRHMLPLRKATVDRCLQEVRTGVIDPFFGTTEEKWGEYKADTHTISFDPRIPKDRFYAVYTHEMVHALSGKTEKYGVFFPDEKEDDPDPDWGLYEVTRVGFSFGKARRKEGRTRGEYTWLNEAITELCTELISKRAYGYIEERAILMILMRFGLSWNMLTKAYFADDDPRMTSGHPTPRMRALFTESARLFGKRFLADLNLVIEHAPTKAARATVMQDIIAYSDQGKEAFVREVHRRAQMIRETA